MTATLERPPAALERHAAGCTSKDSSGRCEVCGLVPEVRGVRRVTPVVAESPEMQALLVRAARFALTEAPVVVLGESGTGKEVVARVLHDNSRRRDAPFIAVNVAALPAELLESELFGHAQGAFTGASKAKEGLFQAASGGTLFLDEIAEMPLALQAKMLRALQDGEVRRVGDTRSTSIDVRVVCATHRDLDGEVRDGRFRSDLYFRLKVLTLKVPPLRERRADVMALARHFLAENNAAGARFSKAARQLLEGYAWPGNVRELASAVVHGLALSDDDVIDVEHLPDELSAAPLEVRARRTSETKAEPRSNGECTSGKSSLRSLAEVEREHVLFVLEACGGNQAEAARVLQIGRNTLWRKLRRFDDS